MALYFTPENVARIAKVNRIAENGYALGFATWEWTGKEHRETLYALLPSGQILTHTHKRGIEFNRKGWKWSVCEGIPTSAEFIGTYVPPSLG